MRSFLTILFFPLFLLAQETAINLHANWKFRKLGDVAWLNASVPGTVHTDLLNNKKIPNPFSVGAEQKLKWIEETDWEYETVFTCNERMLEKQNLELVFEGLDTYASVYLNDTLILQADNMFRSWTISVKRLMRTQNKLRVVFHSAINEAKAQAKKLSYTLPERDRIFSRKAQYQYGWDFAPRYVTSGIWRPVTLRAWNEARVENILVNVDSLNKEKALLNFNISVRTAAENNYRIEVSSPDLKNVVSEFNTSIEKGESDYDVPFVIKKPKLWWCSGLGEPVLYNFVIKLYKGKDLIEEKTIRVGVRTIELVQDKETNGSKFYFKLNGEPVFMKGSNFVPSDVFLSRAKKEDYKRTVQAAVDANMNMLRVWGGGVYPDNDFYNVCDEKGILVWQDLMFACAMYPGDESYINNSLAEAEEQVKRLISHPCVALWCGNNEIDEGWKNWGWQKQLRYSKEDSAKIWTDYVNLFEKLLPARIHDAAKGVAANYISSSPKYGWGRRESLLSGDAHYWGVWWGMEPFEAYNKKVGRFMSEFGFQGMPSIETLQKYSESKLDSTCLKYYEKHPKGFQTINEYMQRDFRMPKTFTDYIYVSQLLQARGLQTAIEAHRRNKPYCMGSLYWQLNDCWPGITWSSVDFDGNWKAAHYAAKKCYADIILSAIEENDSLKVYAISDRLTATEGILNYQLMDLARKPIWKNTRSVLVPANNSKVLVSFPLSNFTAYKKSDVVLSLSLNGTGGTLQPVANYYFVPPKDLSLSRPKISTRWISKDQVEVTTDVLAKNVFLSCNEAVHFEDNFFDLLPGEMKIVKVNGTLKGKPTIKVRSLVDTF